MLQNYFHYESKLLVAVSTHTKISTNSTLAHVNITRKKIFLNNVMYLSDCAGTSLLCGLFSTCGEKGLLSSCDGRAFQFGSFSCYRARALEHAGISGCSLWLYSTGSIAVVHRLSYSEACGIFLDPCIGRQILYHWATRKAQEKILLGLILIWQVGVS